MFKVVKPHKKFEAATGVEWEPVATLKDSNGGILHVVVDDGCYVPYLYSEASGFVPTHYIFSELHELLTTLPDPEINDDNG